MSLYNIRTDGVNYRITKFDHDLNPESSYLTSESACECPAGQRPTCRHRQMFPTLLPRLDTADFYNFELALWITSLRSTEDEDTITFDDDDMLPSDDFALLGPERSLTPADTSTLTPPSRPWRRI